MLTGRTHAFLCGIAKELWPRGICVVIRVRQAWYRYNIGEKVCEEKGDVPGWWGLGKIGMKWKASKCP